MRTTRSFGAVVVTGARGGIGLAAKGPYSPADRDCGCMGDDSALRIPELLMGLAPAAGSSCPRCGSRTSALANGRGRLDFCSSCGTLELETPEGLTLMRMRELGAPRAASSSATAPAVPVIPRALRPNAPP